MKIVLVKQPSRFRNFGNSVCVGSFGLPLFQFIPHVLHHQFQSYVEQRILTILTMTYGQRSGRLGNRIGLHAHLIAYALEHKHLIVNNQLCEYGGLFGAVNQSLVNCFPAVNWLPRVPWNGVTFRTMKAFEWLGKRSTRSTELHQLSPRADTPDGCVNLSEASVRQSIDQSKQVFLHGWYFRAFDELSKWQHNVRDTLQIQDPWMSAAREKIKKFDSFSARVGVHVRHGDYQKHWGGKYYYDPSAYGRAMRLAASTGLLGDNPIFLVVSDADQKKTNFNTEENVEVLSSVPFDDLALLSCCDFIMGPPSTFSNLACFLGGNKLWYIKKRPHDNSFESPIFRHYLPLDLDGEVN